MSITSEFSSVKGHQKCIKCVQNTLYQFILMHGKHRYTDEPAETINNVLYISLQLYMPIPLNVIKIMKHYLYYKIRKQFGSDQMIFVKKNNKAIIRLLIFSNLSHMASLLIVLNKSFGRASYCKNFDFSCYLYIYCIYLYLSIYIYIFIFIHGIFM